jgi:hypothetical protein
MEASRDQMVDLFGNNVVERKIIDRDTLTKVFIENMKGITDKELVSFMYSKYDAVIDFARLCNGVKTGEKISMLFNPHRYDTPTKKSKSIIEGFSDDSFLSGLARATLFKESKVKDLLYQVLQLGINGVQYVNEFPPYIAQDFYQRFGASKILDPCAGWGGRMIGAASVGAYYHGFEPSTKTHAGLVRLGCFLKSFGNGFDFMVENIPFEDSVLSGEYDCALTSPPYYDTEHYSNEETNSFNRYKSFDEWRLRFYLPMIEKAIRHTKDVIINVGSRQYDLKTDLTSKYDARTVKGGLSGASGLGKSDDGKEQFFHMKAGAL